MHGVCSLLFLSMYRIEILNVCCIFVCICVHKKMRKRERLKVSEMRCVCARMCVCVSMDAFVRLSERCVFYFLCVCMRNTCVCVCCKSITTRRMSHICIYTRMCVYIYIHIYRTCKPKKNNIASDENEKTT